MKIIPSILRTVFEDIDDFANQLSSFAVNPVQLTRGALRIGLSTLAFEDVAISRLECNQQVADRLYMDPSWLLIIIQLTPQRWGSYEAPPSSLTLITPDSDYRNMVFGGFRCVEAAVRVDLAEAIGMGHWLRLTGAGAIFTLPRSTSRIAERWVTQLLHRSETDQLLGLDDTAAALRERCVAFLHYLKEAASPSVGVEKDLDARLRLQRFDLAEAALRIIDDTPIHEQPSVTELARNLGTTRRTLLNAFVGALETSPSRYLLARRLHFAKRSLRNGTASTVTDAALDQGFEHFSHFAQHYRTLFGELPSHTLQRASRVSASKTE